MERRFYIGVGLLVGLLILGMFTAWAVERCQMPMATAMEQASQAALSGDFQNGVTLAQEAKESWVSHWKGVASIADHTPMDEIDGLFAEMEVYAQAGEDVHFSACCSQLASLLRAVSDAHRLSWWNVL